MHSSSAKKGDLAVRQCHIFWALSSIPFAGEYITKEKFDKLMALLWEIMQLLMCLPRGMAELRGKAPDAMHGKGSTFSGAAQSVYRRAADHVMSGTSSSQYRRSCNMFSVSYISSCPCVKLRALKCGPCSHARCING